MAQATLGSMGIQLPRRKRAQSPTQKKGRAPTHFFAHVYCGETAGWIKMPLGTEVNVGPGDVVLDGVAAPHLTQRCLCGPAVERRS